MYKIFCSLIIFFAVLYQDVTAQKIKAYEIFTSNGKKVSFEKMSGEISEADLVFFGELHNDPIAHWLQYELVKAAAKKKPVTLGAEMFEADNQKGLNDYLSGLISEDTFKKQVRLWNNYETDYSKIVRFAKENSIEFIATNIPRRYARSVFYDGFVALDTLPEADKRWIAPLPVAYDADLPCYRNMLEMDMGGHQPDENFPKAQAVKDATMAYFILTNRKKERLFIHLNGSYHSDFKEGIMWYIEQNAPGLVQKNITTVLQKNVSKLEKEHIGKADFIICVDEDMTTTY